MKPQAGGRRIAASEILPPGDVNLIALFRRFDSACCAAPSKLRRCRRARYRRRPRSSDRRPRNRLRHRLDRRLGLLESRRRALEDELAHCSQRARERLNPWDVRHHDCAWRGAWLARLSPAAPRHRGRARQLRRCWTLLVHLSRTVHAGRLERYDCRSGLRAGERPGPRCFAVVSVGTAVVSRQ